MVKAIMHGCNGHMGRVITDIIKNTEGIELVAGVDKYTKVPNDYPVFESIGACDVEADVIIDFSNAAAADELLDYCVEKQVPVVLCTTGLSEEQLEKVEESAKKVAVLKSANMSLGINLLMKILKDAGLTVFELSGVEPNPKIETVRKGVEICKNEGIDMVLAIGGGSTIDCSKVVAAGARYDGDAWDLVLDGSKVKAALPIFDVLTLSATGTEMDPFAVISDMSKNEKWGTGSPYMVPTMSILNPEYTFSVSKKQTAAGTADMMSHTMENYFSMENADCQKFMAEGLLRTMIKNGPAALAQPDNYEARANLMWAGTHAINGVVGDGCSPAWCVHPMEHELSAFYDITHGEGLAILTPAWMEHILNDDTLPMFVEFAKNVWGLCGDDDYALAHAGIDALKKFFFETMGIPANLRAVGITDDRNFEVMAKKACEGSKGSFVPLSKDDIVEIYRAAF